MYFNANLATKASEYQTMSADLRASYAGIDEETLADTLEGESELPDLLNAVLRSSLLDEALSAGLKNRLDQMRERLGRLEERARKKRDLVCSTMDRAGLAKLMAEDFSAFLRQGLPRLEVPDERKIPEIYLIKQAPRLDRAGLITALKQGETIEGASLVDGQPHLQVRTK